MIEQAIALSALKGNDGMALMQVQCLALLAIGMLLQESLDQTIDVDLNDLSADEPGDPDEEGWTP